MGGTMGFIDLVDKAVQVYKTERDAKPVWGACDVHRVLVGDGQPRWVRYCSLYHAWVCDECRANWTRRGKAFLAKLRQSR
jgi:hypothetical protein